MRFRNRTWPCLLAAAVLSTVVAGASDEAAGVGRNLPEGLPEGWYARFDTTLGEIVARLLPEQAPQSVAHFAAFADGRMEWYDPFTGEKRSGPYYDGLTVHKVTKYERFEGGDPTETGRGGPPVWVPQEVRGPLDFNRPYRLGLTRASLGRISGAVFFISGASQPFLNNRHPCIGDVVLGKEIVDRIVSVQVDRAGKPVDAIVLRSVRIEKVGNPAPLEDPVPYTPVIPTLGPKESRGNP